MQCRLAAGGVLIDANNLGVWKFLLQYLLKLLGTNANIDQLRTLTAQTFCITLPLRATMMAAEFVGGLMESEFGIAVCTFRNPAAFMTEQCGRVAAAIEK